MEISHETLVLWSESFTTHSPDMRLVWEKTVAKKKKEFFMKQNFSNLKTTESMSSFCMSLYCFETAIVEIIDFSQALCFALVWF